MGIDANFSLKDVKTTSYFQRIKNKKWRLKLNHLDIDIALKSVQTFSQCPKATLMEKIFGKRYVVLQIKDENKTIFIKVNQESLRKRLGISSTKFYSELKQHDDRNMTEFIQNHIDQELTHKYYKDYPEKLAEAPEKIKMDLSLNLALVKDNPHNLEFLDSRMQYHTRVVIEAVTRNGLALNYAAPTLRNHESIVLAAVNNNPLALEFASDKMKANKKVVISALTLNPEASKFVDQKLLIDKDIIALLKNFSS